MSSPDNIIAVAKMLARAYDGEEITSLAHIKAARRLLEDEELVKVTHTSVVFGSIDE